MFMTLGSSKSESCHHVTNGSTNLYSQVAVSTPIELIFSLIVVCFRLDSVFSLICRSTVNSKSNLFTIVLVVLDFIIS